MEILSLDSLPDPPSFSEDLVERCTRTRDFRPMLFEWYKYAGALATTAACLHPDSPALRPIPRVHYAVLTGLLNRCSRLMLSNVRLSCTGRYGETTAIIDRCISESAIKVQWLCQGNANERFARYLAHGLKNDLRLRSQIQANVHQRGGRVLVIEARMLESIERVGSLSGLSPDQITQARSLPNFATMCHDLGLDDLFYTVVQRMGSHSVHGTWSDLLFHYVRYDAGQGFYPRDHDVDTGDAQFIIGSRLVLLATDSFLRYVTRDPSEIEPFASATHNALDSISQLAEAAWRGDFDPLDGQDDALDTRHSAERQNTFPPSDDPPATAQN